MTVKEVIEGGERSKEVTIGGGQSEDLMQRLW